MLGKYARSRGVLAIPIIALLALGSLVAITPAAGAAGSGDEWKCETVKRKVKTKPRWVRVAKTKVVNGKKIKVRKNGKLVFRFVRVTYVYKNEKVCPTLALQGHIDPTFTQNPTNPLAVTYDFSASASESKNGKSRPAASLPAGVLQFFVDGLLACSINVGGGVSGGKCPVAYKALGPHTVVTTYISGDLSGTDTAITTIKPFGTSSQTSVGSPSCQGSGDERKCTYMVSVGSVDQHGSPPPFGLAGTMRLAFDIAPKIQGSITIGDNEGKLPANPFALTLWKFWGSGGGGWFCNAQVGGGTHQWNNKNEGLACGQQIGVRAEYVSSSGLWANSSSSAVALLPLSES